MRQSISIITALVLVTSPCIAFTTPKVPFTTLTTITKAPRYSSSSSKTELAMAMDLKPEPDGGDEMTQIDIIEKSRMKNMGKSEDGKMIDGSDVHKFWMTAEADGSFVQKIRTKLLKEAGKNANFPGFRKGQVPPYAQPQMTMFAVQEGIIQTCESAVIAYGLKSIADGDGGSVEVLEDIKELVKGYKSGDNVQFTASFVATFDEEKQTKLKQSSEAIDAEVVDVDSTDAE